MMARVFPKSLIAISSLLLLAGCSSLNPFASREPKPAELTPFESRAELRTVWQARIGSAGNYQFQPAVVGEDVYAAANDGTVARFTNGQATWRTSVGARLAAGVGSDGNLVAVVTTGGDLIVLDAETGSERWRAPTGAEVLAPPGVGDRIVVVRGSDSRLLGFSTSDGERRWAYQRTLPALALRNVSGILVQGSDAMLGYPGGKLVAINLENGVPIWELTVASARGVTELERITDIVGTPVLGRRDVCAVAFQGRAACFDLTNGSAIWSREFSSSVGMDRDTRFAFITDEADAVHALDVFSGASVWKQDSMVRRRVSRPLAVGDFVIVGDREGYVHALDRTTGRFVARTRVDNSAIVADPMRLGPGRFVILTRDGNLVAFEAK